MRVYRADITGGTSAVPDDAVLLSEGKEYTVDWNENYTSFDITFKDGTTSYFVTYSTTTPNDGTKVANIAALSLADGTKLAQNTSRRTSNCFSPALNTLKRLVPAGVMMVLLSTSAVLMPVKPDLRRSTSFSPA